MKKPSTYVLLTILMTVANSIPLNVISKNEQSIQGGNSNSMNQNIGQSFLVNSNKFSSDDAADLAEILMEERPKTEHNHKKPKAKKVALPINPKVPSVPNIAGLNEMAKVPNVGLPLQAVDTSSSAPTEVAKDGLPSLSGISGSQLPLNVDSGVPALPSLDSASGLIG